MVLSVRQKELVKKQREAEEEKKQIGKGVKPSEKSPVRAGDRVEFVDEPQYNGVVQKLSGDQWLTVFIDYGVPGHAKVLSQEQLKLGMAMGKIKVIKRKELEN